MSGPQRAWCAAWLVGLAGIAAAGFATAPYAQHVRGIPPPHPYPLPGVATVAVLWTAELGAIATALAVRPRSSAVPRAWLATAVGLAAAWLGMLGALHAPWHWIVFAWSSIALVPVLAGIALRRSVRAWRAPSRA